MVLHQLLQLQFLPLLVVLAGEPPVEEQSTHAHTASVSPSLGSLSSNTVNTTGPNMTQIYLTFNDTKGLVLARLNMASNLTLTLASTKCQGKVVDNFCCSAAADVSKCKGADKWKYAGMVVKDKVVAEVPITGIVTTSGVNKTIAYKRGDGDKRINSTQELTLTIQYTELWYNKSANLNYTPPTTASLELVVTTQGENRADYWNLTSAILKLEGSYNKSIAYPATTDVTAQFGHTWAEPACTAPFAPCAPRGLAWTCNDQVFALTQNSLNATYFTSVNATTANAHLPGFRLRLGARKNATGEEFGWDCEPLIPISVWVSVLITIFLASILLWGVCMLAYLNGPTKFDDPKGPSIYVPTAE
jgi:hypothetical protein